MEHVEYTMYPPVLLFASTLSMACNSSSFCRCEILKTSLSDLFTFTDGSLEMTPVPAERV